MDHACISLYSTPAASTVKDVKEEVAAETEQLVVLSVGGWNNGLYNQGN